jgi:flagellar hook protein FlgE
MNPISIASAGVLSGLAKFDSASMAATSAFGANSTADPTSAIADQVTAAEQIQASTATLRTSDRMLKQLLDITV